jgi:hypothetical protein
LSQDFVVVVVLNASTKHSYFLLLIITSKISLQIEIVIELRQEKNNFWRVSGDRKNIEKLDKLHLRDVSNPGSPAD